MEILWLTRGTRCLADSMNKKFISFRTTPTYSQARDEHHDPLDLSSKSLPDTIKYVKTILHKYQATQDSDSDVKVYTSGLQVTPKSSRGSTATETMLMHFCCSSFRLETWQLSCEFVLSWYCCFYSVSRLLTLKKNTPRLIESQQRLNFVVHGPCSVLLIVLNVKVCSGFLIFPAQLVVIGVAIYHSEQYLQWSPGQWMKPCNGINTYFMARTMWPYVIYTR